jgi:tetratricopeptide (TPR) repeat protein
VLADLAKRDRSADTLRELGMAYFRTGITLQYSGELNVGLASFQEARRVLGDLVEQNPANPRFRRDLIRAEQGIANVSGNPLHLHLGDTSTAVASSERALALIEEIAAADRKNAAGLSDTAMALMNLAACLRDSQRERSVALFDRAIGLQRQRIAISEGNAEHRRNLAFILMASAYPLRRTAARAQATARLAEALRIQEELVQLDPKRTQFRHDMPLTLMAMGDFHRDEGRLGDAGGAYRRAVEISEYLQTIHKSDISCERDQADSYERLAALLQDSAAGESGAYLRKSLEIWERWRRQVPSNPYVQSRWQGVVSLLR